MSGTLQDKRAAAAQVGQLITSGWGRKTRCVNRTAQELQVSASTVWRWLHDANVDRLFAGQSLLQRTEA